MNNFVYSIKKIFLKIHNKSIKNNIIDSNTSFNNISFDIQQNESRGHISTNVVFIYLKNSQLDYKKIIEIFKNELSLFKIIEKIEIAGGGFINIFLSKQFLIKELKILNSLGNNFGSSLLGKNKKINIEFISANPTGPLHIAHSRGAVFGDVLSNLLKKIGYDVTREYYLNDSGRQIEILGESLFFRYRQELNLTEDKINKNYYPGNYLIHLAKDIILKDGDKWVNSKTIKRKNYFKSYATKKILKMIKEDCKKIGIVFDNFISEEKIIKSNIINLVFKKLKQKKLIYKGKLNKPMSSLDLEWDSREQLLFKSTNFGDDSDRAFVKSNNEWSYFANDAAYHYHKLSRGFDKLINIWGSDHIGYIKRMKSIVKVLSNEKVDLNIKICQLVHLKKDNKPYKMSKRSGNFITMNEIVNEVGSDVLRFFMLYRKNDTQMDFDLSKVVEKTKDNPIFYVQYAFARSSSVLNISKNKFSRNNLNKELSNKTFVENISSFEWKIIIKILSWPNVIENAALSEEPHRILYYLENLSSLFHIFWNMGKEDKNLRFIDENNLDKTLSRIYWIKSMQIVYRSAFKILGIKPMNKM